MMSDGEDHRSQKLGPDVGEVRQKWGTKPDDNSWKSGLGLVADNVGSYDWTIDVHKSRRASAGRGKLIRRSESHPTVARTRYFGIGPGHLHCLLSTMLHTRIFTCDLSIQARLPAVWL